MPLYLAHWNLETNDEFEYWRSPFISGGSSIDLRSLAELEANIGGLGLFWSRNAENVPDAMLLGDGFDDAVDAVALAKELGVGESILATRLGDAIQEILIEHADPTGQSRWRNLMPGTWDRRYKVVMGGNVIATRPVRTDDTAWSQIVANEQITYRELQTQNPDLARKWLGARLLKYEVTDHEQFIPSDLENVEPLKPETTLGDTFVEASDTNLADHTATGPNSGFGWTQLFGGQNVINAATNELKGGSSNTRARADSDLSSDDMRAEFVLSTVGSNATNHGPSVRNNSSADSCYVCLAKNQNSQAWRLFKITAGSFSQIGSTLEEAPPGLPATKFCNADGSTISIGVDTTDKISETDTSFSGQTRAGLLLQNTGNLISSWGAIDLAAPAVGNPWNYYAQMQG